MTVRTKTWDCGHSRAGAESSNPTVGLNVCLLRVLCVVREISLRLAYHSSRVVLPSVVCLSVISKLRK